MREATIEKAICDYAKSKNFLVYKFTSPGHVGVPDRIFIAPNGKVIFMEVKGPGKKPTALQMREISRLLDHGVAACWCDSVQIGMIQLDVFSK